MAWPSNLSGVWYRGERVLEHSSTGARDVITFRVLTVEEADEKAQEILSYNERTATGRFWSASVESGDEDTLEVKSWGWVFGGDEYVGRITIIMEEQTPFPGPDRSECS